MGLESQHEGSGKTDSGKWFARMRDLFTELARAWGLSLQQQARDHAENYRQLDERITALDNKLDALKDSVTAHHAVKPECPASCQERMREMKAEMGKTPRWQIIALIVALCLTAVVVAIKGLEGVIDLLPKLLGLL
jgi:hypothetical protein